MNLIKTVIVASAFLVGANAFAHSPAASVTQDLGGPAVEWSKAKEHCKELGGKWKPIRKICKIDSITTPGL